MDRETKHAESRRRILDAAADLFFEHGYAGTRVEMICARLSVTKPSLYWYFPSKTAIYDAVSLEAGRITLGSFSGLPEGLDADAALTEGLRRFAWNHVANFKAGTLYYREPTWLSAEGRAQIDALTEVFYADLYGLLNRAVETGAIPEQDIRITARAIGGIIGFMYVWYRPEGRLDPEAMVAELTRAMRRTAGLTN